MGFVRSVSEAFIAVLDWLVQVAERLLVLGIAYVVLRVGYLLAVGRLSQVENGRIAMIADDWKAVILPLIPLFYRTVRIFLENVESAFGMKRSPRNSSEDESPEQKE